MPDALLVFNPVAGRFDVHGMLASAVEHFEKAGWQLDVVETQSAKHTTELARQAARSELDVLLVAGGDGSVGNAVAGLVGGQTALGVLPVGTGNVWARELGQTGLSWTHPRAVYQSAVALAHGRIEAVDVGICNAEIPFLMWAGVGLDGVIVHKMESGRQGKRRLAVPGYVSSLVQTAYSWDGIEIQIEADGRQLTERVILAVACNIRAYAGGLARLSPDASLDDGQMDLWLFRGDTFGQTMWHAFDLLTGRHLKSQQVQRIPFRHLRIQSASPLCAQLDGDPRELPGPVEIEVKRRALNVLLPQDSPQGLFESRSR